MKAKCSSCGRAVPGDDDGVYFVNENQVCWACYHNYLEYYEDVNEDPLGAARGCVWAVVMIAFWIVLSLVFYNWEDWR